MKMRQARTEYTEGEERALKASLGDQPLPAAPAEPYWQNLMIRTNARLDRASSGRALSFSWAARVAVPGVVAITFFLIALHYYAPEPYTAQKSIREILLSLPPQTVDSLLVDPSQVSETMTVADVSPDVFRVGSDQIVDYLLDQGEPAALVEAIPDTQADDLLGVLARNRGGFSEFSHGGGDHESP